MLHGYCLKTVNIVFTNFDTFLGTLQLEYRSWAHKREKKIMTFSFNL